MTQIHSKTRRAWRTARAGSINRLKLVDEDVPDLRPDRVRIQVMACGLNFADIFALTGLYSATPKGSFIPGLEFAGIVQSVGDQTQGFQPGDRVMGCTRFGAYVDLIDSDPNVITKMPDEWTFEEGAAFLVQGFTALYALENLGAIKPGQNVLVHSAAGGVGLQAMDLVRKFGANPLGSVGNPEKLVILKERGYERIMVRDKSFRKGLAELLQGEPLHLVLDAVGGKVQMESFKAMTSTGRLVVFGAATFAPGKNRPRYLHSIWKYFRRPRFDPLSMISANKSVMAFNLIWLWHQISMFQEMLTRLENLTDRPPLVGHIFPFPQAHDALQFLRSGQTVGKVVLKLS